MKALHYQNGVAVKVTEPDEAPRPGRIVEMAKDDDPRISEWQNRVEEEQKIVDGMRAVKAAQVAQRDADIAELADLAKTSASARLLLSLLR